MGVLVGKPAPDFTLPAVLGDGGVVEDFTLSEAIRGRPALLFFYPLDFSTVSPGELRALEARRSEFEKRDAAVIALSIDSVHSHVAWRRAPVAEGGLGPVGFPLLSDLNHETCELYDVVSEDGPALRAAFVIDNTGVVRSQIVNDLPFERDINDLLRLIDAIRRS